MDRLKLLLYIIIIIVIAASLRFYGIGSKDAWLDETCTVWLSEPGPSGIISRLELDSGPPLFHFILHYWMKVFGQSEAALRSLSAIFAVLLVLIVFLIGRSLFTEEAGIVSALIAAVLPINIVYSQEVRMFTLLPFSSAVSFYFLIQLIREKRGIYALWYVIATSACIYTHNYGVFILPAHILIVLLSRPGRNISIIYTVSIICIFILYLPWLPVLLKQISNESNRAWIEYFWSKHGFWGSLIQSLKSFSPGGTQPAYIPINGLRAYPIIPFIVTVAIVLSILLYSIRERKAPFYWLFLYLLVPLISIGTASLIFAPIYLPGRCDQIVLPAFCLLMGAGISIIRPNYLRYILMTILLLFSFSTLTDYYNNSLKYGDKETASIIRQRLKKGDALICTGLTRASAEYYLRDYKGKISFFSYPQELAGHPGNQDTESMLEDRERLIKDAESLRKSLIECQGRKGRIFILYIPNRINEFLKIYFIDKVDEEKRERIGRGRQSLLRLPVEIILISP